MARILHCNPEELQGLDGLDNAQLSHLRKHIDARLSLEGQTALRGLTAAGRMVPARLSAKIAEKALGPVITAEMARKLEPGRSGKVACHLSPSFMADVARYLPAEESSSLLNGLPIEILRVVTHELARRGETIVLATLVAKLPTEAIVALASELDAETLADTALLTDDPAPLAAALSRFAPAVLAQAARFLPDEKILEIVGGLSLELMQSVADELVKARDFDELARLAGLLPDDSLAHLAENVDTPTLGEIARRTADPGKLAESLVRVAPHTLARIIDSLPEEVAEELMGRVDPEIMNEVSRELEAVGDTHIFARLFRLMPVDILFSVASNLHARTVETALKNRETLAYFRKLMAEQAQQRTDTLLGLLPTAIRGRLEDLLPGRRSGKR